MLTRKFSSELSSRTQYFFLWLMALLYIGAGINHFRSPGFYIKMIPPFLPNPELLNSISGGAEIVLGAFLLFKATRQVAALGVILLLIAVFPANIYMATANDLFKVPLWVTILRLPLQFALIAWAYYYARPLRSFLPGPTERPAD